MMAGSWSLPKRSGLSGNTNFAKTSWPSEVGWRYGDIQDGFPLPKRVVNEAIDTRSGKPIFRHEFTFEDLRLVDPPDREFTLAAFGLPELGKPRSSRHANRTVFWLLGAALASLVIAIVLKRYSSTFRQTPSGPVSSDVKPRPGG